MGKLTVYLAGGMESGWQDRVKEACPEFNYIDPRDSNNWTAWDVSGVKQADVIFAYLEEDNPSGWRMTLEMGIVVGQGKFIIFVNEVFDPRRWIVGNVADFHCRDLGVGISMLKTLGHIQE